MICCSAFSISSRALSASRPAAAAAGEPDREDYLTRLEHASIAQSLQNLMTFSYVAEAVNRGDLTLHGAYFDLDKGHVLALKGMAFFDIAKDAQSLL